MTELHENCALDRTAQDLLFRDARTANTFSAEPVGEEQVAAIYDLIKYAPTAFNSQPLRILLVRSTQARARLVEHLWGGNRPKTLTAPLAAVFAYDPEFHEHLPTQLPHFPGAQDLYKGKDKRFVEASISASLQAGYFILGVRAVGLAAGPMTGLDAAAIDKEFFTETGYQTLMVVNIGKPGEDPWLARGPRLEQNQVITTV